MRNYKNSGGRKGDMRLMANFEDELFVEPKFLCDGREIKSSHSNESSKILDMDLKNISRANCGFMKFARLLAEGKIPVGIQEKYWNSISKRTSRELFAFSANLENCIKFNLTAHMKMTVLVSFKRHKHVFGNRQQGFVEITLTQLGTEVRAMRAQGLIDFNPIVQVNPDVKMSMDFPPFIEKWLNGAPKGLSIFFLRVGAMTAGMCNTSEWTQRAIHLVQFLLSYDSSHDFLKFLHLGTKQVLQDSGVMVAQGKSYEDNKENIVAAMLAVLGNVFSVQAPNDVYRDVVRVKRIDSLARICMSATTIVKFFQTLIEWLKDIMEAQVRDTNVSTIYLSRFDAEIPTWMEEVTTMYENSGVTRSGLVYTDALRAKELWRQGTNYLNLVQKAHVPMSQLSAFSMVYRFSTEMMRATDAFFGSDALRPEPFVIYLYGKPGQGKSTMLQFLANDLLKAMGIPFDRRRDVYVRNPTQDHWDGYMNQTLVMFDDFLQSRNPDDRVAEVLQLLRTKNNMAFPLKMAELSNKGNVKFTSPLIFITSNGKITDDINVVNIDAIKRRRDLVVQVEVKAEFTNGVVPVPKLIFDRFGTEIHREIYKISIENPITGEHIYTFSSFAEFVEYAADSWKVLRSHEEKLERAIDDGMLSCVSEKAEKPVEFHTPMLAPTDMVAQGDTGKVTDVALKFLKDQGYVSHESLAKMLSMAKSPIEAGITAADWDIWQRVKRRAISGYTWASLRLKQIDEANPQWKWWLVATSSVCAVLGALHLCINSNAENKDSGMAEAFGSGDSKTLMSKKEFKYRTRAKGKHIEIAQGCRDKRGQDLIRQCFIHMTCRMEAVRGNGRIHAIQGILIGGKLIAVPNHFIMMSDQAAELRVVTSTQVFTICPQDVVVCNYEEVDLAIMTMPKSFPNFPKQIQHFIDERDLTKFAMSDLCLILGSSNGKLSTPMLQFVERATRMGSHQYILDGDERKDIQIVDSVHYNCMTEFGDCGAPLIWLHPSINRKIVGFHVCGGTHRGASNILTKDFMTQVFIENTDECMVAQSSMVLSCEDPLKMNELGLIGLGRVEKQYAFRQPAVTEIEPSLIHGYIKPSTMPAALKQKNGISPLMLGIAKSAVDSVMLPQDDLDQAVSEMITHYNTGVSGIKPRILTYGEAINGVEGLKWVKRLNPKTSPGFPYICERTKPGKLDFLEGNPGNYKMTPQLFAEVDERERMASNGIIKDAVFVDVLKDERREIEKVLAMKTRVFNTCPMDLNVAIRRYFGMFAAHIMSLNVSHETAAGINYHSSDWEMLYRRLASNGSNWIAGDYSNYDKMFPRQLMQSVADIANAWYDDDYTMTRVTLMETLCCRTHLALDEIYLNIHGNPSGNPLTVIINSLGNSILMRLAWYSLARQWAPKEEYRFSRHVQLSVYGDDNLATVDDSCVWYNCLSIAQELEKFGMTYTPPKTVGGELQPFLEEKDVTYLKRYFRKDQGKIFAPLVKHVIHEIPNWIRKSNDPYYATTVNIFMAQLEMFHWGKKEYEEFDKILRKACSEIGLPFENYPYSYFYDKWSDNSLSDDSSLFECDLSTHAHDCVDATRNFGAWIGPRSGSQSSTKMIAQGLDSATIKLQNPGTTVPGTQMLDAVANVNENAVETIVFPTRFEDMAETGQQGESNIVDDLKLTVYPTPSLTAFLERPFMVQRGTWKSSDTRGSMLEGLKFPHALISLDSVVSKLKHFGLLRCGFKFTVRMNGTKFHYGRLLLAWYPIPDYDFSTQKVNLFSLSSCPHVIVSPCENEVRELIVPFVWPHMYYNVGNVSDDQIAPLGALTLMVMNPLQEGSATNDVHYTIYASMVDPILDGPTAGDVPAVQSVKIENRTPIPNYAIGEPQSRTLSAGPYITNGVDSFIPAYSQESMAMPNFANFITTLPWITNKMSQTEAIVLRKHGKMKEVMKAQGKTMAPPSIQREQIEKSEKGVLSGVAQGAGLVASALAKVPGYSMLGTVGGALQGISGWLSSNGFCKPTTVASDTLAHLRPIQTSLGKGLDNGMVIGVDPANSVGAPFQWMGGKPEAMSIGYLAQTPSLVSTIQWLPEDPSETDLFYWPVCPMTSGAAMDRDASGNCTAWRGVMPILANVGAMFQFWRGSLRFTFQIIASGFHSGRLRIAFEPFGNFPTTMGEPDAVFMNAPNVVVDIQQETEVSIEVPYVFAKPWAYTNEYIGVVRIDVINALTHPSSPCPPVEVNIWVAGGSDIEFARPTFTTTVPGLAPNSKMLPITMDLEDSESTIATTPMVAQGLTIDETRNGPFKLIAPAVPLHDRSLCMGETITDVKEITNIPYNTNEVVTIADQNSNVELNTLKIGFTPQNFSAESITPVGPINWLKRIYRVSRGSYNVKMMPNTVYPTREQARPASCTTDPGTVVYWNTVVRPGAGRDYANALGICKSDKWYLYANSNMGAAQTLPVYVDAEFKLPYYSTNLCVPSTTLTYQNSAQYDFPYIYGLTSRPRDTATNELSYRPLVSTGDDFSFGCITGAPLAYYNAEYFKNITPHL